MGEHVKKRVIVDGGPFVQPQVRTFRIYDKQKTGYDVRNSDWISDVCSSDLGATPAADAPAAACQPNRQAIRPDDRERAADTAGGKIGRASCRERVCQ